MTANLPSADLLSSAARAGIVAVICFMSDYLIAL